MTPPGPATPPPLSSTARTTVVRGRGRAVADREALHDVLRHALVCHLGVVVGEGDAAHPVVLPTAFGWDAEGPDAGGSLYLHGSVASRSLVAAPSATVCVTLTLLDGLVLARSGFHHSANYRSAVVLGTPRVVADEAERARALDLVVDQVVPGRSATLRAHTRKELAATTVLALPLLEASVKVRAGDPVDEPDDVAAGAWAGVVPLRLVADEPVTAADAADAADAAGAAVPVPADVVRRVAALAPH